jgi:hypothetical protein
MKTYKQALAQRHAKYAHDAIRAAKQAEHDAKFAVRTDLHPAVGALINASGVRYYAFVNGVYREGSPEHLASLLTHSA